MLIYQRKPSASTWLLHPVILSLTHDGFPLLRPLHGRILLRPAYNDHIFRECQHSAASADCTHPRTRATEPSTNRYPLVSSSSPTLVLIHSMWHPFFMSSSQAEVKTTTFIQSKIALRWTRAAARKDKDTSRPRRRRSTLSFWSPGSKSFRSPATGAGLASGK